MRKIINEQYDRGYGDGSVGNMHEPGLGLQEDEHRSYTEGFADSRLSERWRQTRKDTPMPVGKPRKQKPVKRGWMS